MKPTRVPTTMMTMMAWMRKTNQRGLRLTLLRTCRERLNGRRQLYQRESACVGNSSRTRAARPRAVDSSMSARKAWGGCPRQGSCNVSSVNFEVCEAGIGTGGKLTTPRFPGAYSPNEVTGMANMWAEHEVHGLGVAPQGAEHEPMALA